MTATKGSNITSIVLLVVAVLSDLVLFVPALMLAMVSDNCGPDSCNMAVFTLGYYIAVAGPTLVTITGIVFTVRQLIKKQDAVTYALIGLGGTYGAFMLGLAITFITVSLK
ncbi:hypothetical protein [Aurantimicrobium sp. MWH-Uga1]|uniref:hypothetical protein n=1 Tax=Aurantimicrobium sp. MWH-Uga1 TaxID=2079575 RepID=UPI000DEDB180|nr:hypothetical protein [Aurantimicrobium sp. MWH-Uga1]AXE55236.1 hypothetical protein AURUGA1_01567 [Aurantimicrobium sp. MWH-Uga1]